MKSRPNREQINHINALYRAYDNIAEAKVVPFVPALSANTTELLSDIEALLSQPQTRKLTEDTLRTALQHIARTCVDERL